MFNFIIKKFALHLVDYCIRNKKVYYITGGDKDKRLYLIRYIVFKTKYLSLFIHRFMRSDSDDPHDHPFNFITYIISGGYSEVYYDKTPQKSRNKFTALWTKRINRRLPGSIAYRKATDVHQVVVDRDYEMSEIQQAPFTLCLIGPRTREWGFWPLINKGNTWIDWRRYLNITPNDPRTKGSE